MRFIAALGLACSLLASSSAYAVKVDLRQVKCDEFLKQDKDFHGQILMWMSAYSMKEEDDPIVDFDKIVATGQKLGKYCAENPTSPLMTAYENAAK